MNYQTFKRVVVMDTLYEINRDGLYEEEHKDEVLRDNILARLGDEQQVLDIAYSLEDEDDTFIEIYNKEGFDEMEWAMTSNSFEDIKQGLIDLGVY